MRWPCVRSALVLLGCLVWAGSPGAAARAETLVTVTTASDASNGDVSSVAALLANPGLDGISLREAIEATNNDPGSYGIRFDASLSGATILVGATWRGSLPPLTGGGVSIDGDIDGDGHPDVTLADRSGGTASFGFDVVSSGNRLHALALQGFPTGVLFTASPYGAALPTGQTFAGNVVSGLVITGSATSGIRIWPAGPDPGHEECVPSACRTRNRWTDTQVVGNTIESGGDGIGAIEVALEGVAGDVVERLTVEGNVIRLTRPGHGINLTAGGGAHADSNRIADVLVAHNTIEAPAAKVGINTWSGVRGGSANLVEDLRILENTIRFSGTPSAGSVATGIAFAISDGCYPSCSAGNAVFPEKNVVRRVEIVGNVIEGSATGIVAADPCCAGTTGSLLTDVRIADNTITSTIPRHDRNPWGIAIGTGGALAVSNVVVEGNTVVQRAPGRRSGYAAYLAGGGIAVLGGLVAENSSIRNVVISGNRVDTPLAGITIVGGGPSGEFPNYDATGNRVAGVQLRANTIVRAPVLATRWDRRIEGISVIGGLGGPRPPEGRWPRSTGNSVSCVTLNGNTVAGTRDAVSVFANLGPHASRNTARLGGC